MGLDNGVRIMSNVRKITREMLPKELSYVWEDSNEDDLEIVYWRKNWGLRNEVVRTFSHSEDNDYEYYLDTVDDVFKLIRIIVSFMNKEKWDNEGSSIWEYEEVISMLQNDIINLCIIAAFMKNNPDIYLIFYDSY